MQYFYFIIVAVVIGVVWYMNMQRVQKTKADSREFLAQHPEAAKIYLASRALISSEAVVVATVDGEPPHSFYENRKSGLYVTPGRHTLELNYTHNRPGFFHKNVSSSTGFVKQDVEAEANTSYNLGFDRDADNFTFEKVSE
jgi:hypothetical protein